AVHYGGADYVAKANDEIVVMGMVETKEGLANLDAICATPGLDAVYIGPSDLSFALGIPPGPDKTDPVHMGTCDKILDTAHTHGIALLMLTSDLSSLVAGARRQLDELKTLV